MVLAVSLLASPALADPAPLAQPEPDARPYEVRLRNLERRVEELKERVRGRRPEVAPLTRAEQGVTELKSSLDALGRKLAELRRRGATMGVLPPVTARLALENHLSPAMRLVRVQVLVDGAPVADVRSEDALARLARGPLFDAALVPGEHRLEVLLEATADGHHVFTYARAFGFDLRAAAPLHGNEGESVHRRIIVYERGGVTTPFAERLGVAIVE